MSDPTATSRPLTRDELYARIRSSSRDAVILDEMIRLGFWPPAGSLPEDPADEIRRQNELSQQLRALRTEQSRLYNEAKLLRELRKQRLKESREKRKETKERRLAARRERARRWRERKRDEIVHLGIGVSVGLNHKRSEVDRLQDMGLPVLHDAMEMAVAMDISLGELRFLAFQRRVSRVSHYRRFLMPKKTGGERLISAPMPRLKEVQRWVLDNVLSQVPVHDAAHGFVPGRSIVTGAKPHVGAEIVINLDLEDFFPTINWRRVRGVFAALGYSEQASTIFALLCSEPDVVEAELDGQRWFVQQGERHLPQGAPTSPAITNVLCRKLDEKLSAIADDLGFVYTRYADDLSFSGSDVATTQENVRKLLARVRATVQRAGFSVHPKKTRVMRKGRRREVTGIVVNDKPSVDRATRKRWRAAVHALETRGPAAVRFGRADGSAGHDVVAALDGYASFVLMVDEERGRAMKARLRAAAPDYARAPTPRTGRGGDYRFKRYEDLPEVEQQAEVVADKEGATTRRREERQAASEPNKPWWKFW
jgi:retron-type reverse transcriptase